MKSQLIISSLLCLTSLCCCNTATSQNPTISESNSDAVVIDEKYRQLNDKWEKHIKYSPADVEAELRDYVEMYPEILSLDTIGFSVENRPLLMLRMGHGETPVFALAAIHAREYITTVMVMKDIEQMALCHKAGVNFGPFDVRELLDKCSYYIVPMMNPDGVDISQNGPGNRDANFKAIPIDATSRQHGYKSWKANANGVDLNRNYPQGWKENKRSPAGPNSNEYKGPKPESEPETKALIEALQGVGPDGVISYHTQGEILYISDPEPLHKLLGQKIQKLTGYPRRPAGRPYGSLQDYVDDELGVFYVCVELCPSVGPYPYPDSKFFDVVWPRARYVLPLAGAVLSGKAD